MQGILLGTGDAMESKPDVVPAFTCSQCGKNNRQLRKIYNMLRVVTGLWKQNSIHSPRWGTQCPS